MKRLNVYRFDITQLFLLTLVLILVITCMPVSVLAQPADPIPTVPSEFEANEIPFWNPYLPPCTPVGSTANLSPGVGTVSESESATAEAGTAIGPKIEVGVSVYGNWGDDNGRGMLGPHKGHTMFAELSTQGTMDFALLANMLNAAQSDRGWAGYNGFRAGTKFRLTYQGRSIIMEKRDVGGGGGPVNGVPRAVDLWWETAQLIGWTDYGLTVMEIQQVADSTPVTPLGSAPDASAPGSGADASAPGGTVSGGSSECAEVQSAAATGSNPVSSDGYAFPIQAKKNLIDNYSSWPCSPVCHHDGTGALDLTLKNIAAVGTPVIAITDGTIKIWRDNYAGISGCNSFHIHADGEGGDGAYYYYTHIQLASVKQGDKVTAGQQIAVIGETKCATVDSPHLHIDRGFPIGRPGGTVGGRDPSFPNLVDRLYEELPE